MIYLNPNEKDQKGNTLLHRMVKNRVSAKQLEMLLNVPGIDINAINNKNRTALFIACKNNDFNLVKTLMFYDAKLNITDKKGKLAFDYLDLSYEVKEFKKNFIKNKKSKP